MSRVFRTLIPLLLLAAGSGNAWSATRKACFEMKIADIRVDCPTPSEVGAKRPCDPDSERIYAVGHEVEAWDKDWEGADEYIGTWRLSGSGTQCITFEWENAPYSLGETDPDVYLMYINRVADVTHQHVTAVNNDGSGAPKITWRNGTRDNPDAYVALNCKPGVSCRIWNGYLIPTTDETSATAQRIMALDSAQHVPEVYGADMDTDVKLYYPDPEWSYAVSRSGFHIFEDHATNGMIVTHELGHVQQMQEFNQDYLRDVCGDSHSLTSIEEESCSTTEGWANYVASATWYDPNNSKVIPYTLYGYNIETAAPWSGTCATNGSIELQVAKAFWDLDDYNQEAGAGAGAGYDDSLAYTTTFIGRAWREFPSGIFNRQDYEFDNDGVNAQDYYGNNDDRFASGFYETFLQHNCLQYQDPN